MICRKAVSCRKLRRRAGYLRIGGFGIWLYTLLGASLVDEYHASISNRAEHVKLESEKL